MALPRRLLPCGGVEGAHGDDMVCGLEGLPHWQSVGSWQVGPEVCG